MSTQTTISPHSQKPFITLAYPSKQDLDAIVSKAVEAQTAWKNVDLKERIQIGRKFIVRMSTRHEDTMLTSSRMSLGNLAMRFL